MKPGGVTEASVSKASLRNSWDRFKLYRALKTVLELELENDGRRDSLDAGRETSKAESSLQLLEELAGRARNVNPARDAALAVLDPLHNTRRLAALRAIRALGGVHDLLAVRCLCNLSHGCH